MRYLLILLIAAGGYHFVSQSLSSQPGTAASMQSLTSSDSASSWFDSVRNLLSNAGDQLHSNLSSAEQALPPQTQVQIDHATRKASSSLHLDSHACGSADSQGNIHYCYNDEK